MKRPRNLLRERDGNIGTLAAISLPLLIFSLALGVDYGYLTVQQSIDSTPVRRIGRPEDIAAACAFLASEEAGYITGQILGVNGGRNT